MSQPRAFDNAISRGVHAAGFFHKNAEVIRGQITHCTQWAFYLFIVVMDLCGEHQWCTWAFYLDTDGVA